MCEQFGLALADGIDVAAALQQRPRESRRMASGDIAGVPASDLTAPPRIVWFDSAPSRSIVEVRAADRPGLLARLAAALEGAGIDIVWAKATTRGSTVDDVFCVVLPHTADRAVAEKYLRTALD